MEKLHRQLDTFLLKSPRRGEKVYVTAGAIVLGDVHLGDHSSVWYHAVLRGDINTIRIGRYTNIQDGAVLHVDDDLPCTVGDYVTIGHQAIVHACTIGSENLIGMGSVILDGAVIGNHCLIGAKALVTQGAKIPDGSLVLGMPGKVVRQLSDAEKKYLRISAEKYAANAAYCIDHQINCG